MRIESIPGHPSRVSGGWEWRIGTESAPWSRRPTRQECADAVQMACERAGITAAFGRKQAHIAVAWLFYGMADTAAQAALASGGAQVTRCLSHVRYDFADGSALVESPRTEFAFDATVQSSIMDYLYWMTPEDAQAQSDYISAALRRALLSKAA